MLIKFWLGVEDVADNVPEGVGDEGVGVLEVQQVNPMFLLLPKLLKSLTHILASALNGW